MTTMIDNEQKTLNVPNLRFPEFEGEWEKKRLGDFTERVKRKNKYNLSKLPLTISAKYGLVDQITFFNKIVASTDMSNYYLLKKGEFAYNKSYSNDYPWGAIKRLDNYEQGVLSALYICFATQDNVESDFILQYFESPKWHKSVSEIAVEGARNHGLLNISVQDFFQTYHYVPKEKKEQTKIATLLHLIDERISTQNKIIEDLKKLRSAISKQLFERRDLLGTKIKLSKVAELKNGYAFQSSKYNSLGEWKIITITNVTGERYIKENDCNCILEIPNDIQKHQKLKANDILISLTGNVGRVSLCTEGLFLLNQRVGLLQLKVSEDREYIYQALSSHKFENSMIACAQGAAQMNIGKGDVENYILPYSFNRKNISIVASILRAYDKYIINETNLQSILHIQKQYLLRQMFI